jgi:hypothetical protein
MAAIFAFTCACCGQRHEGSPSFGYPAPAHYSELTAAEKAERATLTDDTCQIRYDDGHVDYFARVVLEIPIHGVADPFLWGVWVSLSEQSYTRYTSSWGNHDESDAYFGWLSNRLPHYTNTINLRTHCHPRNGGMRPRLELEPTGHLLSVHAREGLSIAQAQAIAQIAMHGQADTTPDGADATGT